jgi:DIM1 family U5 snRNP protein
MGSVVLPHLRSAWHVDQAILSEEDRLVVCEQNSFGSLTN